VLRADHRPHQRRAGAASQPASQFKEFKYLGNDAVSALDIHLNFVQMYKLLRQVNK